MTHSDIASSALMAKASDRRQGQRYRIDLESCIELPNGRVVALRICDISSGGIGGQWDGNVCVGTRLLLSAGNLCKHKVMAAWVDGNRIGMRLDSRIPVGVLHAALTGSAEHQNPANLTNRHSPDKIFSIENHLIKELISSHDHLLVAVRLLEECTATDAPSFDLVFKARLRLNQAESRRRIVVQSIVSQLSQNTVDGCQQALVDHRRRRAELDQFRTAYVHQWTPDTIRANWRGYQAARAEKCRRLRDSVANEQTLFLP